eukprot:SAG31_NODE_15270_length_763_cov_0.930723_1_plen_93_part_00
MYSCVRRRGGGVATKYTAVRVGSRGAPRRRAVQGARAVEAAVNRITDVSSSVTVARAAITQTQWRRCRGSGERWSPMANAGPNQANAALSLN